MMTPSDFNEELRQRALRTLATARAALTLDPQNATGKMAPHVAADNIRMAAAICKDLDVIAAMALLR